ncbi:Yip1 family protein [Neobacillus dielmonensis]|uniref:Yip1 family protein n=1 Tax=Neobacillus dielmonensis TaxID=1347369 RepID=UPI000A84D1C2|nr:Yip1 family protein [Neobacillus dielmonensis]
MEMQTEVKTKKESPSLFGMFTSPSEQFIRIKANPKIWLPLLIVSILYAIGLFFMVSAMDVSTLIDQGIPENQADLILGITKVTVAVTGIVTPIISVLFSSAIHLLIAKAASSTVTFKQLFSMNTFIMVIGAAGIILNMAIRFAIGGNPETYVTSLAGLLNLEKPGGLASLEFFGIWSTILTAIGLHKTAEFSKGLAWTIAIIFFLVSFGIGFLGGLLPEASSL